MQMRLFEIDEPQLQRTREPSQCPYRGKVLEMECTIKNECLLHNYWTNCIDIDECMDDANANRPIRNARFK